MKNELKDLYKRYDMKRYLLIPFLTLFFMACNDDDGLGPTQGEKNWLVLEDSDDPIDHQRYEIFTEFNIPVYYNDTIGSETRYDMTGIPYTYYECLQVFYNPGSNPATGRFTLVRDKNDVKPMLDYLQNEILPVIPETFYVPSILLVDTLKVGTETLAYRGLNTVTCGQVKEFAGMDEENRKWYKGGVLSAMITGGLLSNESEWLEKYFFGKSLAVDPESDRIYSGSTSYYVYSALAAVEPDPGKQTLGRLGFLNHKLEPGQNERMAKVPTREQDLRQFCEVLFVLTPEEIEERWSMYPVVMEKFEVIVELLKRYNFI